MSGIDLDACAPSLRWAVLATIPVNATGALLFSPAGAAVRHAFGMAPIDSIYAAMLGAWILVIGGAFWAAHRARRVDASVLAIASVGKLAFVVAMITAALLGRGSWIAAGAAFPDLALGAVFLGALSRARLFS